MAKMPDKPQWRNWPCDLRLSVAPEAELVLLHDRCDCLWGADARVAGKSSSRLCDRDGPGKLTLHETRLEGGEDPMHDTATCTHV